MVLHANVKGVDFAVCVEHGAVRAEKVKVEIAVDKGRVQWAQHGQALEGFGVAELGLEGNPGPVSKKATEGG